ncbi:MAG: hypothetical protein HAW63_05930 [Bdellovibrionaceae bacterium]|nr:hypothetical protein [Pseudobdellovibrionaceae bacterium]
MKIIFVFFCLWLLSGCKDSPKKGGVTDGSVPSSPIVNANLTANPYEFVFDTIAYMSCSNPAGGSQYPRGTFFTFKVGAYNPGAGLKLSSDFLKATAYSDLTAAKRFFRRENSFNASYSRSGEAQWSIQLSVRGSDPNSSNTNSLNQIWPVEGGVAARGTDYHVLFPNRQYGSFQVLTQLLNLAEFKKDDPYLRYAKGNSGLNNSYFEQSLGRRGLSFLGASFDAINELHTNRRRLTALYAATAPNNPIPIKASGNGTGRSFALSFNAVGEESPQDRRKLVRVTEYRVKNAVGTKESSVGWSCGSYQVMRHKDRARCATSSGGSTISSEPSKLLERAMENVWGSTGFWKFDHDKKCAVFQLNTKASSTENRTTHNVCYDEVALADRTNKEVAYQPPVDNSSPCDSSSSSSPYCPHFLSACWRHSN